MPIVKPPGHLLGTTKGCFHGAAQSAADQHTTQFRDHFDQSILCQILDLGTDAAAADDGNDDFPHTSRGPDSRKRRWKN